MPENSSAHENVSGRTAWVLAAPGAGDNHQLRSLARLIAGHIRWFDEYDPIRRVLLDRLQPGARRIIPESKRTLFTPPWPDLVLIAGGRSVIDAMRIRNASGGHSRVICIGRPWAPLAWFDLVITTPQYQLPESASVICLPLPLNLSKPNSISTSDAGQPNWQALPRPWSGVLLGGDSGSYRFTTDAARAGADRLNQAAGQSGGSTIVIGSPRTPAAALDTLESRLKPPCVIHRWQADSDLGLLPALLKAADTLWVTSDSASMLAEAIYSGRPVSLLELPQRWRSRWLQRIRRLKLPGQRLRQGLIRRGLWLPARDLSLLHARAQRLGLIAPANRPPQAGASPNSASAAIDREIETLKRRIDQLFDASR